jgi:hypothetical protein
VSLKYNPNKNGLVSNKHHDDFKFYQYSGGKTLDVETNIIYNTKVMDVNN